MLPQSSKKEIGTIPQTISLTCVCAKLLKHIFCKPIMSHFSKNKILTPVQHSFQSKHSCESQGPVSGTYSQMSRSDIAHLHMRIVKIERVGQSARILPIHVKEGVKRGKSTRFFSFS